MKYPEFKYVELAFDSIWNRNKIRQLHNIERLVNSHVDCYRSIFRFPRTYYDQVKRTGSVKGFSGLAYTDWLVFDIDRKDRLEIALSDLRKFLSFLRALYNLNIEQTLIYFSGNKGFHILLPAELFGGWKPSESLPLKIRDLAFTLENESKIEIDRNIYDVNRLLRLPNTKHSATGLFKVELPSRMALHGSLQEIIEWAGQQHEIESAHNWVRNEGLSEVWEEVNRNSKTPILESSGDSKVYPHPNFPKPCIVKLLSGVEEGRRHLTALRLADYWWKEGHSESEVLELLMSWGSKCKPEYNTEKDVWDLERITRDIFTGRYDYGCNDIILSKLCDENCRLLVK